MGSLVRFFKGGFPWEYAWKQTWTEILFYYDNFELQITEEEVIRELSYDNKGNKKKLPPGQAIRDIVNERIAERRQKLNG